MKEKLSFRFKLLWSTGFVSVCVVQTLTQYMQIYATDTLGINVALLGTLLMLSKFVDAFTDSVGGIIVDKTNSRLGKGRPFDLALIGYWGCTILLFSTPDIGMTGKVIYVITMYVLATAIFATLFNCGNPIYLANALSDKQHSISAVAFAGVLGTIFSTIGGVIVPILIQSMGTTPAGWRKVALIIGVPMILIGFLRFLFIKEKDNSNAKVSTDAYEIRIMLSVLVKNKPIIIVALISCLSSIGINLSMGVSAYYCTYIMKDFGLTAILSLTLLAIVFVVMFVPALTKKISLITILKVCALVGGVGFLLRLLNIASVPLLIVSSLVSVVGFYTFNSFVTPLLIDGMDYGEWKYNLRCDGALVAVNSLAAKVGTAVGMGLTGVMMGLAHYDGRLEVQPDSANKMIVALSTWVPAVFCVIEYLLLRTYDIDKYMPQIRKELVERHAKEESND